MTEQLTFPPDKKEHSRSHLSLEALEQMDNHEIAAWYLDYVTTAVPESNIQVAGSFWVEKKMDLEAFERYVSEHQEGLRNEV